MKIAIVSDTHFGFKWDTERADDSFRNAREAFERTRDADVVVLPGDIFDNKVPKQEVLDRAADLFNIYRGGESTVSFSDKSEVTYDFDGTAVVAIHGTHERRTRGFVNPIELLETMGYLLHLHNEVVVFEKDGERVAIHGMSGVPERYAPQVLQKFAPEPLPNTYNMFVFHQSVKDFVYTDADHDVLTLEELPAGFDLLVDGHIHWKNLDNLGTDKPLVFPGSTITTQMRKIEAETPKGFLTVDTESGDVDFHPLEQPRDLYYETIDISGADATTIHDRVADRMDDILADDQERKPLIRLILQGETDAHLKTAEIRNKYRDRAILSITTRVSSDTRGGVDTSTIHQSEKSIAERGRDMLVDRLDPEKDLPVPQLFDLLADEALDEAADLVEEMEAPEAEDESDGEDTEVEEAEAAEGDSGGDGTTLADYAS